MRSRSIGVDGISAILILIGIIGGSKGTPGLKGWHRVRQSVVDGAVAVSLEYRSLDVTLFR
jgi:hypothetical protein